MFKIGLTGGIASGKSYAARQFARYGARVFDADKAVAGLLCQDLQTIQEIQRLFPDITKKSASNTIDTKALATLVFSDSQKLAALETLLHPKIRRLQAKAMRQARQLGAKLFVAEIPLLFEADMADCYDVIVLTTAPHILRRRRALQRGKQDAAVIDAIMARQMPEDAKRELADIELCSGLGYGHMARQIRLLIVQFGNYTRYA